MFFNSLNTNMLTNKKSKHIIHKKNFNNSTDETISDTIFLLSIFSEILFVADILNPNSIISEKYITIAWAKIMLPYNSVPKTLITYGYVRNGTNKLNRFRNVRYEKFSKNRILFFIFLTILFTQRFFYDTFFTVSSDITPFKS